MNQKRYVYMLQDNCKIVGVTSSMKKLLDTYKDKYVLPKYNTIARKTADAKSSGNPIEIDENLKIFISLNN